MNRLFATIPFPFEWYTESSQNQKGCICAVETLGVSPGRTFEKWQNKGDLCLKVKHMLFFPPTTQDMF